MDLSKGVYKIKVITLSNCSDKALSVGENSNVNIHDLSTSSSDIGIAVKDSSNVEINNFTSEKDSFCIQMYRKKANFGSSELTIGNLNCKDGDIYIGKFNEYQG